MNIIIGISHPKHVYIFKNLYFKLTQANHNVYILVSNKEMTCELLDKFQIKYKRIGTNKSFLFLKLLQAIYFVFITLFYSLKTKPDIFIGFGYIHFALVSFILRRPFIFPEDTEAANRLHKFFLPFISSFLTTKNFKNTISNKQIRLNANLELAYLHPNHRNNESIQNNNDKYALLRFVSWKAFHDKGHTGMSDNMKEMLIKELSKYARVFIASEHKLPDELEKYQLLIDTSLIHDFVAGAELVVGESPTMTTEAALLGTPAICISSWACALGNFEELMEQEMIFCFKPQDETLAIKKAIELIQMEQNKIEWKRKANLFIKERIDLTNFLYWFIEEYPRSHEIMKSNPDYQNTFK